MAIRFGLTLVMANTRSESSLSKGPSRLGWNRALNENLTVILDAIRDTDIEEVEVEFGTELIRVRLVPELSSECGEASVDYNRVADGPIKIAADRVGTFFRAGEEETHPLVNPGDRVEAEDPIGYIDSLQIRYELLAVRAGRLISFVVADGEDVEYGQLIATISADSTERS